MRHHLAALVVLLAAAITTPARAVVVDFEGLPNGSRIGTLGLATFSTDGSTVQIYDFNGIYAASGENTVSTPRNRFAGNIYVDFAVAVTGLSFYSAGDDAAGSGATIRLMRGGKLVASVPLMSDGDALSVDFHDLAGFPRVTRLEIVDVTDPSGMVYDDFAFVQDLSIPSAPVPAAGLLLGSLVLGGLALGRVRKGRS